MLRPRPRTLLGVGIPIALVAILLAAWAIDAGSSGGRVVRNVSLGGQDVGRMREDRLTSVVREVAADYGSTPVEIRTTGHTYKTTAEQIGLSVDEPATVMAALDVGRTESVALRPLNWVASFFHRRDAPMRFKVRNDQLGLVLIALEGDAGRQPQEPEIRASGDTVGIAGGRSGFALDAQDVAERLIEAAEAGRRPLTVRTEPEEQPPTYGDDVAQRLADDLTAKTAEPLLVEAGQERAEVPPATVRSWLGSRPGTDGLDVTVDADKVVADLTASLAGLERQAADASITLGPAGPVITPSHTGLRCCKKEPTAKNVLAAIEAGQKSVRVPVIVDEPDFTTEEAEALGIKEPVGTTVEWKGVQQVKSFTTYHACCESRVTNIHRMADLVRGAIIPPGKTFSINDYVGQRTTDKGFVPAGAIANGEHSEEVGGGVSQFATTLFNAAFFAGLDYGEYQSHSISFDRYPRGREATMGYEHPDLQIENNTPYGVMIWTSYTETSLTVTMYSTQWVYGQQTGQTESPQGNCTRVTTTRTRTYNDGHTDQDEVYAVYRPDYGINC
jgi:vancomycin resistance protein YoaR